MKISVIILNWNGIKDTVECIKSIEKVEKKTFEIEIVIVDNASTDTSISTLEKFNNIILLRNTKNLGFAKGNNVGIRYALENQADFICVLNNDTEVDSHLFTSAVMAMKDDKKIGALSPKIYFAKGYEFHKDKYRKGELGKVIWYAGGTIDWNNVYGLNRGVDEVDNGQYDILENTDYTTGACTLFRSEALKEAGLFDEKYYMYFEDDDLSMRLKKLGWRVVYDPKGIVWHKVAQSSGIGSNLNDYFITRNRLMFGMKYASIRAKLALMRESIKFLFNGRFMQKRGVLDFYLRKFEKGSWE